ncbi:MAG: hypothetical protein JNG88_17995 [Phycisphaerales bacterium]|nr:hypothetical protein [Phycisphaerales bacterium]
MTTLTAEIPNSRLTVGQRVAFVLQARMGDVIAGIPTARRLIDRGVNLHWYTYRRFFDLLPVEATPVAVPEAPQPGVRKYPLGVDARFFAGLEYDTVIHAQPGLNHDQWTSRRLHICELIADLAGEDPRFRPKQIMFPANLAAERAADQALGGIEHFVCMATGPNFSCPAIADDYYAQLVRLLREKMPVVCIGGGDARAMEGAHSIVDLTPRESAAVIARSAAYIGADTGTTWLAMAASQPFKACLLSGVRMREGRIGFADFIDQRRVADFVVEDWPPAALARVVLDEC